MNESPQSVYRLGAEDGLIMGPLMAVTVLLMGATAYIPGLFFLATAAMIAVPSVAFLLLARAHRARPNMSTFSALWLQGICMFFFGSLIMAVAAYAGMRWLCPTFISDQIDAVVSVYGSVDNADARAIAATLQKAAEARSLPTPIEVSLEMIYMAVFSGSLLSMVLALIVRARRPRRDTPTPPPFNPNK